MQTSQFHRHAQHFILIFSLTKSSGKFLPLYDGNQNRLFVSAPSAGCFRFATVISRSPGSYRFSAIRKRKNGQIHVKLLFLERACDRGKIHHFELAYVHEKIFNQRSCVREERETGREPRERGRWQRGAKWWNVPKRNEKNSPSDIKVQLNLPFGDAAARKITETTWSTPLPYHFLRLQHNTKESRIMPAPWLQLTWEWTGCVALGRVGRVVVGAALVVCTHFPIPHSLLHETLLSRGFSSQDS